MSNEASGKTRRGVRVYDSNPFLQSGLVKPKTKRITNRRGDMMVVGKRAKSSRPSPGSGKPRKWIAQVHQALRQRRAGVQGLDQRRDASFEVLYLEVQRPSAGIRST